MSINYNALAIPKGKTVKQRRAKAKRSDVKGLKAWRDAVWRRESIRAGLIGDRAVCQSCAAFVVRGDSYRPGHVHHIVSRRHKRSRYDVENGRLLCRGCHNKVHGREF